MKQKNIMRAAHSYSGVIKVAITLSIALSFGLACTSTTAYAKKKRKVKYGQIEITTNPGGFPLRIDGKPEGNTSTDVRVIELEPGHHNVEITLPNGGRWCGTSRLNVAASSALMLITIQRNTPSPSLLALIR